MHCYCSAGNGYGNGNGWDMLIRRERKLVWYVRLRLAKSATGYKAGSDHLRMLSVSRVIRRRLSWVK